MSKHVDGAARARICLGAAAFSGTPSEVASSEPVVQHEIAPLREEFDNLSAVVRKLAAKVMWIFGTPITVGVKPVPQPEVEALLEFKGFMEEFTEVPRLQVRDLRVLLDADNDGNSVPPRNSRFLPVSEEPQLSPISVPHENQPGEDFFPTLVKGPVGPSGTGSSEETPITSPPVFAREVPAENGRPSPKQEVDGPQPSPAEEPRLQDRVLRERAGAGYEDSPMPP